MVPTRVAAALAFASCLRVGAARADVAVVRLLSDPAELAHRLHDIDPRVASAQARLDAASAAARQARVVPNPQLVALVGNLAVGPGNHFGGMVGPTSFGDTGNLTLGINELVELGKRGPRSAAADARIREAREQGVAALGARVSDATAVLGRLAHVVARRDVVAANLAAARKLQELEQVRLQHQDLAPVDFERIELETHSLELELDRADADVATSLAECHALLQDTCATAGLDASVLDRSAPLPARLPDSASAIAARPLRVAARSEVTALQDDARLAAHRRIPDPVLGINYVYDRYEYGGSIPHTLLFSLNLPLPLFDTGTHDAAVARANARALASEDQAEVREASGTVGGLLARRDTLTTMLAAIDQQSLPRSTRIIEQTRKAFDLGQSRLADLLLVERAHRDLLLDAIDTRFELFEVRAQLREALGLDDDIARSVENR